MIDPEKITNFNRTDSELEELILFAVLVAGKNARTQALKLHDFLGENVKQPFKFISSLITADSLIDVMQHHGLGKYNLLEKSFTELVKRFSDGKLRTATVDELEQVPGIGMKTARFFVLHSRENSQVSVIDTHLLKYLAREYPSIRMPKTTPQKRAEYLLLEELFLKECQKKNVTPYNGDLTCWITQGRTIVNER
jgi:thermostable 8-oxoguanine DNA glycosylase